MDVLNDVEGALVAPAELTIREVEGLRKDLIHAIQQGSGRATVALGEVEQIDTAAVQVLFAAGKMARELGGELILTGAGDACRSTVSQLGLLAPLFGPIEEERES